MAPCEWMGEMSCQFQVLCHGTNCNGCGATFSLSKRNAEGLPSVKNIFEECGQVDELSATSEATTIATNNTRAGHTRITDELEFIAGRKAISGNHHEVFSDDIIYLSTAAVSGAIVLLILIALTAYCICRRGKRNNTHKRVSKQIYQVFSPSAYHA